MLVSKLLSECSNILIDAGNTRWTASELLDYYNMCVRILTTLIPSCYTVTTVISLDSGTRQTLPAGANSLIQVTKNMGTSGIDEGRGVSLVNREIFDRTYPGWTVDTAAEAIIHYMYDGNDPYQFHVYPSSDGTGTVEIIYSATPTDVTDSSDTILLRSDYIPIIYEGVLWFAFTKDSDSPNSSAKATEHKENYRQLILAKGGSDLNSNPNLVEIPQMRKN